VSIFQRKAPENLAALAEMFDPEGSKAKALRVTHTDEAGVFEVKGLQPGQNNMLVVEHAEFQRTERGPIEIPEEGDIREDLTLEEGYKVFGYVRDAATGGPIVGAKLWLDNPLSAQLPADRVSADRITVASREDGLYEFLHITPGTKWLVCSADGYGTVMISNVLLQNDQRYLSQDITMHPELTIAGHVLGPDHKGIEGATLDAMSYNVETLSRGSAVTGPDGVFVIRGLAEAEYSVTARAEGFGEERKVRVTAGTQDLQVELSELGGVMGRVVDADTGRALVDFKVSARMVNLTATFVGRVVQSQNVRGADNGAFHLRGLPPGSFVVQISAEGYADTRSEVFTLSQGLTEPDVLVRMTRGGGLKGRVVSGYTNEPIAGAVVSTQDNNWVDSPFTNAFGPLVSRTTTDSTARTDKDGEFHFSLLTQEAYQVNVKHPSYTAYTVNDVQVFNGRDLDLGVIKLYSGATVSGTVFLPDGSRAVGATVSMHPTTPGLGGRSYETRTNSEGRYKFTTVAPENYKLSAARQAQDASNPFGVIVDMKQSEKELPVIDQKEYTQDLYLGSE
jgi:protocatechuate 3,4-dioxygenase beta subunit